jgi:hypothetical protein
MYAFLDDAFESPFIKRPREIWELINVPGHRHSTPIHFKKSMKDVPILRRATRNKDRIFVTDPEKALLYIQVREWEEDSSALAGLRERGSLYKYRKRAAANLNSYRRESNLLQ